MLSGIQCSKGNAHAEADGGTESHDEKDFGQYAAVGVVEEIDAAGQQNGGEHQDQADTTKNPHACAVNVPGFFMILAAKGVGHVGEDCAGKSQIQEAVVTDKYHRNRPDAVLFLPKLMHGERHEKEADGCEKHHTEHAAAGASDQLFQ